MKTTSTSAQATCRFDEEPEKSDGAEEADVRHRRIGPQIGVSQVRGSRQQTRCSPEVARLQTPALAAWCHRRDDIFHDCVEAASRG
eukprot:scaffold1970_cov114-Isochrysis_galbana.AAC.7